MISNTPATCKVLPDLQYTRLTGYITGDKKGWRETDILPQRFSFLCHIKPITNRSVIHFSPLIFCQLISPLFWLTSNVVVTIQAQGKVHNCAKKCTNLSPTVISTDSAPWTPCLQACSTRLTGYRTGDGKFWSKTDNLLQRFGLLHNGKKSQIDLSFVDGLLPLLEKFTLRKALNRAN